MRIINKKYLLIILLVGVIITGVIIFKPKEEVKLDNVILKQEINNKTFAMYKEDDENNYVKVEGNKFPDMYVLNIEKSKCIDNNGNKLENVLSYENNAVTITSGNTTYCYLYFDKSLGLEIKEDKPKGLSEGIKGAMYRFQGQAKDESGKELVNNYICFGTSEKDDCTQDTDHHMYRIIGIEAETGRVKVIKKEALENTYQWWNNYDDDIEFPQSDIYKAISGTDFLQNEVYIPNDWIDKISNNTWIYGDMFCNDTLVVRQTGEGLYLAETGQKGTIWDTKANAKDEGAKPYVVENDSYPYYGDIVYYIRHINEKWNKTFDSKVSLMYLHDYYYSVSDEANCLYNAQNYEICQTGWMHLSNNDTTPPNVHEWTMIRLGFSTHDGFYDGLVVGDTGDIRVWTTIVSRSIRPVFFIDASQTLKGGEGTIDNPFIIS